MEELEGLDREAIKKQYQESYEYSKGSTLIVAIAAIIVVLGFIAGFVTILLNFIDIFAR